MHRTFPRRARRYLLALIAPIVVILVIASTPAPALALDLVVDRFDDDTTATVCAPGFANDCSLRGAIRKVNLSAGPHTIEMPAGTYTLTTTGAADDTAAAGDLDITANVSLGGHNARTTIIQAGLTPGSGIDTIFDVRPGATLNLTGVTLRYGKGDPFGPGGMEVQPTATANLFAVEITQNSGQKGGIANYGVLTIAKSTIANNVAQGDGSGGGIYQFGSSAFMNVENSTISGNEAEDSGGGVYMEGGGLAIFNNVTLAYNRIGNTGSGGGILPSGSVTFRNSILAHNTKNGAPENCLSAIPSSLSLDSEAACGFTYSNANPLLEPLALIGCCTRMHAVRRFSPAIDAGSLAPLGSGGNACAADDQRFLARAKDGNNNFSASCDLGSYELDPCDPRFPVALAVTQNGSGLSVTATAGFHFLSQLRFHGSSTSQVPTPNVVVDIGTLVNQSGEFTFNPSGGATSQPFTVRRATSSGSGTLVFDVVDECGVWPTFVGGGPNVWGGGGSSPGFNGPNTSANPSTTPRAAVTTTPVASARQVPGVACQEFPSHAAAQAFLRANPSDPLLLDRSRNGIACEGADGAGFMDTPLDHVPVPRP